MTFFYFKRNKKEYSILIKMSKLKKEKKTKEDGIYYKPEEDGSTHFISVKNNKTKDPYKYYQFPNTHGFCQLFAFFLHIDDTKEFQKVYGCY